MRLFFNLLDVQDVGTTFNSEEHCKGILEIPEVRKLISWWVEDIVISLAINVSTVALASKLKRNSKLLERTP